jgi:hypothetical protein
MRWQTAGDEGMLRRQRVGNRFERSARAPGGTQLRRCEVSIMKRNYHVISGAIFGLVAILQAVRAVAGWTVQIGPITVPVLFSWVAAIVAGSLSVWAFRSRAA